MLLYILNRTALAVVTLLFVICLTYMLMNTVPGGPFLGEKAVSPVCWRNLKRSTASTSPCRCRYSDML